jgi:transcriptional regulator with XRE-family HTH domain
MKLKQMRINAGLSQSQLAIKTGLKLGTIQCYEQGKKSINGAKIKTIYKLASALKCTVADIIEDDAELIMLLREVKNV